MLGVPSLSPTGLAFGLWVDSLTFLNFSSLPGTFGERLFDGPFSLTVVRTGCTSLEMSLSVQGPVSKHTKIPGSFLHVC